MLNSRPRSKPMMEDLEPRLLLDADLETGVLTDIGSTWQTATLSQSYSSMVVVCTVNYEGTDLPAVARVRNASGNSFDVKVQNPSDSVLSGGYDVHYMVVEEGVYTQAVDGVTMEAVRYSSTVTDRKNAWSGQSRSYANSYTNPVVLGQVMSANDADWSVFWASNGSRTAPPSSSSLYTGKHVGEDSDTDRLDETIGYLVIEGGTGTIDGQAYSAGVGNDVVRGMGNSPPFTYSLSGLSSVDVGIVSAAALDGSDGGWPVLHGSAPVSATSLDLAFDEDQVGDSERSHTTEQVAYLVIEPAPANQAPVASDDAFSVDQDSIHTGTLSASDPDSGPSALTYELVVNGLHGSATITDVNTGAFTYDPDDQYDGADSFTFRVYDGADYSNTATVSVTVNAVSSGELMSNGGFELGDLTDWTVGAGTFTVNSTDPQAGSHDVYHPGTTAEDEFLYQSGLALTGGETYTLSFYYRVDTASIGAEGWRYAQVGIWPNSGPSWAAAKAAVQIDDNTTTAGWVQGSVQYTPTSSETVSVGVANWRTDAVYGFDSFSLTGPGGTANQPPTANDGAFSVDEDDSHGSTLSASDPDTGPSPLTYEIVANGTNGLATITDANTGAFTYDPSPDYNGSDSFTFRVYDGADYSNTATMTVTVNPVNDAPTASDGAFSVDEDGSHSGTLGASDIDGTDTLTFEIVANGTNGLATITDANTGAFTYDPSPDYNGGDSFTFRVYDGADYSNTATMTVTVNPVNDAPTASDDTFAVAEDAANGTSVGTVSANDPDVGPQPLAYSIDTGNTGDVFAINSSTGEITVADNTNLDYEQTPQYSLVIEVTDGVATDQATITINVTDVVEGGPNLLSDSSFDTSLTPVVNTITAPVNYPQDVWFTYDSLWQQNAGGYIEKVSAASGNTWQKIAMPAAGDYTLSFDYISSSNSYIRIFKSGGVNWFSPSINNTVGDMVTLTTTASPLPSVGDWTSETLQFTLTTQDATDPWLFVLIRQYNASGAQFDDVTLTAGSGQQNQPPTANDGAFSVDEDGSHGSTLSASDPDTGPSPLTYEIVANGTNGLATITDANTGAFTYDPSPDYNGSDSFTFRVYDGADYSNTATMTVTVNPVNDAPTASDGAFSVDQDDVHTGTLSASDIDGTDTLTYEIVANGTNGLATITDANTGAFTYDPDDQYDGADSFTFRVYDGTTYSNTATMTVTVDEVQATYSAVFDGSSSSGSVADSASLDINGSAITIEAWVRNQGPDTWDGIRLFRRNVMDHNGSNWTRQHGLSGHDNGQLNFGLVLDGLWYSVSSSSADLPEDTWAHVAAVYDGSTMKIYIDGVEKASAAASGNLTVNSNSWVVGQLFQGKLDELRVSNVARYTSAFTPAVAQFTSDANTALLVHFNEGTGSTAADDSGNGNDASLTSVTWDSDTPVLDGSQQPPVAADDGYGVTMNSSVTATAPGVLDNDTDANSDPLTAVLVSGPSHGELTLNANGSFTYTPEADYTGGDSFTYRANDGLLDSGEATVTLTIIDPSIYEWAQDAYGPEKTSVAPQDPGSSDSWSYAWGWNGPGSTPGTADGHTYDAPRLGKIVTGGAHIYAPAGSTGLYAIRKSDGTQAWQFTTASVNASPAYHIDSDTLLVGGADGVLYKLDAADGSVLDSYDTGNAINLSVTLVGDNAYVVTDSGQLHKVNVATMASPWASPYSSGSTGHTPAAYSSSADKVIFATYDLNVHAVSAATGSQSWKVKPTVNDPGQDANGWFREFWAGHPVVAEQHGIVFVRMITVDPINSGPGTGGLYPNTNAAIRQHLINNPEDQNLFALDLADGSTSFIPAVGPGGTERYLDGIGPRLKMQAMPIVKTWPNGDEVVYIQYRNGSSAPPDGRWDSHLGEMVLDDTTVSGMVAGDVRFVQFDNSQVDITDEQTPLTMAGDTIFNSHWGASESATITDRSDALGTYASPIQSSANHRVIRRQSQTGTPDTNTHWTTSGLTLYDDGRYWDGPGWWAYWNVIDPPGEGVPGGNAYSAGILPRYTIVADGMVIVEGNGGDLMIFDTALNSRPVVEYGSLTTNEDTPYSGTVSGTDLEGDNLTFSVVQQPTYGWVGMAPDGSYTFYPSAGWNGTGSFTYKAQDGNGDSANHGRIDLTVISVADDPVSEDGSARTIVDVAVDGQVAATDGDPDDTLTFAVVDQPDHGSLTTFDNTTGEFTYTPDPGWTGTDTFTFHAYDGSTWSNTATQTVTVNTTTFTNLLTNPDFESGLTGWDVTAASVTPSSAEAHSGSGSAFFSDGQIRQEVPTVIGNEYKITAWIKLASEAGEIDEWGGFQVSVIDTSTSPWSGLNSTEYMRITKYGTDWYEIGFEFTATQANSLVQIGLNAHENRTMDVYVDDLEVKNAPAVNTLPIISQFSVTPTSFGSLPATQNYSLTASDPDGAIVRVYWDFGDGDRAFTASGSRSVGINGTFTGRAHVVDDDGEATVQEFTWSASDASKPTLAVDATPDETNASEITLTGSATGTSLSIQVSTDEGRLLDATGGTNWSVTVPLHGGENVLTVQAVDSSGNVTTVDRTILQNSTHPVAVTNVWANASSVERWDTIEVTFDVTNSAATHPQFPYDAAPAPGMEWVDGCTVDVVFWEVGSPGTTYTRPAFLYQDYDYQIINGKDWYNPSGDLVWKVRFAPPDVGNWRYRIEVTEAKGSFQTPEGSFTVTEVTDPDNHGPIVVSPTDSKYFEYADGTLFTGNGHGVALHEPSEALDLFDQMGNGANQNLLRDWVAGDFWGASWQGWKSRTLQGGGNTPETGLSAESAFASNLSSLKLDANNPIMHNANSLYKPSLVAGETYVLRVRWRTEGVTGPDNPSYNYGLTVKLTGFPEIGMTYDIDTLVDHVHGDSPWHMAEGSFVATDEFLDSSLDERISIILENTSGGSGYVDSISLHQVLADGSLGANVLQDPSFNAHKVFDQRESYARDIIFDAAEQQNIHFKLVIEEKEDWVLQHYDIAGLPSNWSTSFFAQPDTATYDLHTYYWRYMMARWGASRAVHSWEFINEGAPRSESNYRLASDLAAMADADGNPHLATTSAWSGLNEEYWTDPAYSDIDYADFHCYVEHTGWISPWLSLHDDSARFFHEYDLSARAGIPEGPIVWGEMGIDYGAGSDYEETDIANDNDGTWLHKIVWARTGPGGVYPLYWWSTNIFEDNLHGIYGAWNSFIADVPLTNGHYQDIAATITGDPHLRVMGQKDTTNLAAHLWIDNSTNTWKTAGTAQSGTITFTMGENAGYLTFDVAWYDTATGTVISTNEVTASALGEVDLSVSNLATDTAVKITRQLAISNVTSDSGATYQYVADGMASGATAYTDQSYTVSSLPSYLEGAHLIRTADSDADSSTDGLSFDLNASAWVYVAHDTRYADKPDWLQDWQLTGDEIVTTNSSLTLYRKAFNATTVDLAGNSDPLELEDNDMFMVIIDEIL